MKKSKSGFTLVELMVVAAIVAILAAILIPLLSANKDAAIATEASTICGTLATECKTMYARTGNEVATDDIAQSTQDDIDRGRYFDYANVTVAFTDPDDWSITVEGDGTAGTADNGFSDETSHDLVLDQDGWSGDMVDQGWVGNN